MGFNSVAEGLNTIGQYWKLLRWYLQLVRVEGLVSSDNPQSQAGDGIATNRVFQAGQVKRVGTRRREIEEGNFVKRSSDDGSSVISNNLKHRANDASDGPRSYSNRRDQSGLNGCCTAMWKANGKITTLLLFLDSLFLKIET
jgi:hypothetical protein